MNKYSNIASELRKGIVDGTYGCGDRLPTIPELCAIYGVSKITDVDFGAQPLSKWCDIEATDEQLDALGVSDMKYSRVAWSALPPSARRRVSV